MPMQGVSGEGDAAQVDEEITENTYTHAMPELINARKLMCEYSS